MEICKMNDRDIPNNVPINVPIKKEAILIIEQGGVTYDD
jgi:hypothetical protein